MIFDFFLHLQYKWRLKKAIKERELEDNLAKRFCQHEWHYTGKIAYFDYDDDVYYKHALYCSLCHEEVTFHNIENVEHALKVSKVRKAHQANTEW